MKCDCKGWNDSIYRLIDMGVKYCPWCGRQFGWPRIEDMVTVGHYTTYATYAKSPDEKTIEREKEKRDRLSREKDRKLWKKAV